MVEVEFICDLYCCTLTNSPPETPRCSRVAPGSKTAHCALVKGKSEEGGGVTLEHRIRLGLTTEEIRRLTPWSRFRASATMLGLDAEAVQSHASMEADKLHP
ncbi:hypothetical protein BHM03_00000897 [Ensete ventricosum]|uniref:Uncharacterized protein n=1 Tax=Ensete ventricosum TaxID=4639 RepID=A0A426ZC61_ENSVE|nr:hypothetical protein B296_00044095 [Ensete ventricosum]RZR76233.1 hypothetical protein BHM03_00000897 [Ensete ventricosum]